MSDTTLAASQPAPLAGRPSRPKPIIAAVGAREGATVLAAADLVARRSGGALTVLSVVEPLALYSYGPEAAVIPPGLIEVQRASRLELVQKRRKGRSGPSRCSTASHRRRSPARRRCSARSSS